MRAKNKNRAIDDNTSDKSKVSESHEALDKATLNNQVNRENINGIVSERATGTSPNDSAGVSDIDASLSRGSRRSR